VTPYLVDPTHPDKLQTPIDGFVSADDNDALLLGRLNKVYGENGTKLTSNTLPGPFGHVVVSAMGLMVTACAAPQAIPGPSINNSQITISESIERLELYARPNGMSLSSRDQSAVAEFLAAYGQFGDGPLYINVPGAQSGSIGTQQSAQLVRQTMAQMGMGVGAIQSGQYQSNPAAPSPVVVSYRRMKVVPQDCRTLANLMKLRRA